MIKTEKHSHIHSQKGFTVVELLVVVLVIGILAGIVILGYGAWRKDMAKSIVKSDLRAVTASMENARSFGSVGYPTAIPNTYSASNTVQVSGGGRSGGGSYCVSGTSTSDPSIQYYVSNKQKEPKAGDCTVTTAVFAGNVSSNAYVNGTGTGAQFFRIEGFGVANDGTVYVGDEIHLRRITPAGVVTTYNGTGADGFGAIASGFFQGARGVAADSSGNVYVIAINDDTLFKIAPNGVRTVLAPNLHGTDVILGADNNFYALEGDNWTGRLFKVTMSGTTTLIAGNATNASIDGQGTAASLLDPRALARAPDGTLYICQSDRVRKVSQSYYVSSFASSTATYPGGATSTIQGACGGIAVDKNGLVYIASGSKIQTVDSNGTVADLVATPGSVSSMTFDNAGMLYFSTGRAVYKVTIP